ncbi:Hypothetical predicted protein, partial [Drosophila guanche]
RTANGAKGRKDEDVNVNVNVNMETQPSRLSSAGVVDAVGQLNAAQCIVNVCLLCEEGQGRAGQMYTAGGQTEKPKDEVFPCHLTLQQVQEKGRQGAVEAAAAGGAG